MIQINLRNVAISYSSLPLIENVNISISSGDHICLIGRNGVGKSTLLKLIKGDIEPDTGLIEHANSLKIALLQQAVPDSLSGRVVDIVTASVTQAEEWEIKPRVEKILSKLQLDGSAIFNSLSGGLKRRVLLASILVDDPDVLLLDEPTNHLDVEAISWLENFLITFPKTLIFITHDRMLMQNVANHFIEIDNGNVSSWRGKYSDYLRHKQASLEAEQKENALFDKRLAEEERWIRQGIKARRTRNEGRVRLLKKMREERGNRRIRPGQINLEKSNIALSGKVVFEVSEVSYSYHNDPIIKDFSTVILRGDKIGIIGANGSGKTTLLNLLLGNLSLQEGTINLGTKLIIGYFDQYRLQLDENKTVFENVCETGEIITIGDTQKHIMSYLQDFLFSPARARTLVKNLSGGERNRVMLAKLFSKSCNLLVLDEPTNDLDIETLELLEEQLINFSGTILLVSHDRAFLNNVVTSTLVFEEGEVNEYVGGYDDWLRQRKTIVKEPKKAETKIPESIVKKTIKLSYKEQRELELLPKKIEELESKQQALTSKLSDPHFYKDHPDEVILVNQELKEIELLLQQSYEQWEILEEKAAQQ